MRPLVRPRQRSDQPDIAHLKAAHMLLTENGSHELSILYNLSQETGVWKNPVLERLINLEPLDQAQVIDQFLVSEAPILLEMRIKQLLKLTKVASATTLAKLCSDHLEMSKKGNFTQLYLTCLCAASPNIKLIEEIAKVDCKDALDMICNLESEGDEKTSLILCAAFLSRQLQFGEMYCAWELTLFWSKLQRRVDPSIQIYLERCRQLSLLTKTVYHIFFLIKVIQSETEGAGLPTCIELCVRALRLESSENSKVKISICKTISCLLPDDLEVKRACQLTEFLLEPTVDAYYAVEMLYNQPDQKYDEESLPVPNSLRCELLLVLKTRWPFDPEFWDWKTLKRQCLALMGAEASIVSSIDELNDNEAYDQTDDYQEVTQISCLNGLDCFDNVNANNVKEEEKQKKKNIKKMRERGYISERFRNWQAYMQYCVLCDKEFLGHRIVRHAQKHFKDGIYSCPICAQQYSSKEYFVPHVTFHVKQSCKERLETMKPLRRIGKLPKKAPASKSKKPVTVSKQERPIKKNSLYLDDFIVFNDNDKSDDDEKNNQSDIAPKEEPTLINEFACPVQLCKKGFKYFKNLIAHVRGHKGDEEATRFLEIQSKKVVCQYCRRQFVSLAHLNDHLQMHCGDQPYICIQMKCKASFETYADLLSHRKEHRVFRARCMFPKCGRIFSAAYMLFDHEAQHYNTFTCKYVGCGKIYHSQLQLEKHLSEHVPEERLLESKSNMAPQQIEMPGTVVMANKQPTQDCPVETNFEPGHENHSNHSSAVLPQKEESIVSNGIQQTPHLLDHHLPPITEVLPFASLLNQMLPSSSAILHQTLPPEADMLNPSDLPVHPSSNVKLQSAPDGCPEIVLNQSKLVANNLNENKQLTRLHFEEPCLPVFEGCKTSCPVKLNKENVNSSDAVENKMEVLSANSVESQVSSLMPFEANNQASQLCENNLDMSGFNDNSKPENALSLSLETSSMLTNVLPSVGKTVPVQTSPPQKFKCSVEACTRIYNSVQSMGKHMKTAHPDHYDDFKMERKNRKKLKRANSGIPSVEDKPTYCILPEEGCSNPVFQPQVQSGSNPNFCSQLQHIPNPIIPSHLENLNPILSSVESIISQSLSKNVADSLLGTDVGNLTSTTLTSQLEDLAKVVLPLKFENGSDPFLPMPTENDPLPVMSSLSGVTVFTQLGSNTNHDHVLSGGEAANSLFLKEERDAESSFSKQADNADIDASFNLDKSSTMLTNTIETKNGNERTSRNRERKPRHSSRPKCPAIIRDGKFICSRCFRAFTNPRSLGGHLSKRAVCKPHNEYDGSQVVPQVDGQASVLASMILSSSPKHTLQSPTQTYSPEVSIKEEPFLPTISSNNQTTQFFSSCVTRDLDETKKVMQTPEIVKNRLLNVTSGGSLNMSSDTTPLTAFMSPTSIKMEESHRILHSDLNNFNKVATVAEGSMFNNVENGLCSNASLNAGNENNCLSTPVSSTRVSVISGPQNSSSTAKKKKCGGTKKKKKNPDVTPEFNASNELAKNLLAAVGGLPQNVGGSLQMPNEMQPNFLSYSSELIENIAKHLNNTDKQLFLSCINDSIKAHADANTICQTPDKPEKCDSLDMPTFASNSKDHSEVQLQTEGLNCQAAEVFSVNGNAENACFSLRQSQNTINQDIDTISRDMQNIISATVNDSPNGTLNIPICSASPTQEADPSPDAHILEIMDLVQKLQLVDNVRFENIGIDSVPACPDYLPMTSSVIVPNPRLNVVEEPDVSKSLPDKGNAKPFICQEVDCTYCAMTKDALFKHYAKVHYYTQEKIMEIKKHQLKFAPFKCVVPSCTKTFTRNSNLRAHCQSMHNFTPEQMVKLKIKRAYGRKSGEIACANIQELPHTIPEMEQSVDEPQELTGQHQETPTVERVEAPKEQEPISPQIPSKPASHILQALSQKCKRGSKVRRKTKELIDKVDVQKDIKPADQGFSTYKPYQCVHQGCTAAFTIQQNLMLHYQAVHKSVSKFSLEEGEESENGFSRKEFRCMETDCSRIFQEVGSLIQHYMKLHEMIAEEIENVLSVINIGEFKCDQLNCASLFSSCTSYIEHLEEVHEIKRHIKMDGEEMYKCDCEGCDRVYATRSNLLRHIFNKHNDKHKEHLIRPRKFSLSDQDTTDEKPMKEKPRVPKQKCETEGNNDLKVKGSKGCLVDRDLKIEQGQTKQETLPLKYGRHTYSLKPKDAAFVECSDNLAKQYPCMIRGCTSVVTSERSIIRHYKCHKLSRAFILKHRNSLIVCKRRARPKSKTESTILKDGEDPNNEISSKKESVPSLLEFDESSLSTSQPSENEKDEMDELAELFISKLSNEDSTGSDSQAMTSSFVSSDFQETSSCQSEPQKETSNLKRTNKQKHVLNRKRKVVESDIQSTETSSTVSGEEVVATLPTAEEPPAFDLSSFKPLGFEVSFLKFLEASATQEEESVDLDDFKAESNAELHLIKKKIRLSVEVDEFSLESSESDPYLLFANPLHLSDMDNIKIVLDQKFNDYIDLVVKQLNELKPVVVLRRCEMLRNEPTSTSKENILAVAEEATA
ncbi:zinc finger protein 292 isoform X2 [Xenopus laevis]|uniref:Zinc finger protein 292 isoform X2 n=1 Tax=Xenopus laevis TaxID=8355 RepID=A0A8J1KQE9_XENLA|nr:zinc finger protein 292 isoform X2 [Xenopus laevis]